jgi:hypothetical protein
MEKYTVTITYTKRNNKHKDALLLYKLFILQINICGVVAKNKFQQGR